jgi:hypothetical protein
MAVRRIAARIPRFADEAARPLPEMETSFVCQLGRLAGDTDSTRAPPFVSVGVPGGIIFLCGWGPRTLDLLSVPEAFEDFLVKFGLNHLCLGQVRQAEPVFQLGCRLLVATVVGCKTQGCVLQFGAQRL